MDNGIQKWQRSVIRKNLERYREALDNYYIRNKRLVDFDGYKAWSLLSPPLNSPSGRRRVHFIMRNIMDPSTVVSPDGSVRWGTRTPHFLTAGVTYDCQCQCVHCSAARYKEEVKRRQSALSLEELKDAFRQAVELGTTCVILSGGEPLLLKGVEELIASVDPQKSICAMFSNGEFLTLDAARRLRDAGLLGVFVSLDSTRADEHDAMRGRPGLFEKALAAIRNCQETGLLTGISTYITHEKIRNGELEAMMELGKRLDVLEMFLFDVIATGRLLKQRECMLTGDEVEWVSAFRKRYNEMPDYPRIIHQTMFTSIAYPCAAEGCPAGVAQMHLRGNGDVSPCDFTPWSFGNVRETPLAEIWRQVQENGEYAVGSKCCRLLDPAYWEAHPEALATA